MHELPVVEDMIRTIDKECAERGIERVHKIHLEIGELSGIIGECVQMYFDLLSAGHTCEKAELLFSFVPASLRCMDCSYVFPHNTGFDCPLCGGQGKLIRESGREFRIRSLEY